MGHWCYLPSQALLTGLEGGRRQEVQEEGPISEGSVKKGSYLGKGGRICMREVGGAWGDMDRWLREWKLEALILEHPEGCARTLDLF